LLIRLLIVEFLIGDLLTIEDSITNQQSPMNKLIKNQESQNQGMRSKRMSSTPARNGPWLSADVSRRRTVWPAHGVRSKVTGVGDRDRGSPGFP
jgi:hypothetical protein